MRTQSVYVLVMLKTATPTNLAAFPIKSSMDKFGEFKQNYFTLLGGCYGYLHFVNQLLTPEGDDCQVSISDWDGKL